MLCAGAHEAVENGGASRGVVRTTEEIVASTEGEVPHLLLTDIIVKAQASIVDEAIESRPVVEWVAGSLGEVRTGRFASMSEHEPPFQLLESENSLRSSVHSLLPIM